MDRILSELSTTLPNAKSVEELARPLLDMLGAITGLESTYLTSIDLQAGIQHVRYARNEGGMQIPEGMDVPWADTLCKRALDEGRTSTSDVASCWPDSEAARKLGIQTYVSAPVRADDGTLLGTLCGASASQQAVAPQAEAVLAVLRHARQFHGTRTAGRATALGQCAAAVICAERSAHRPAQSPRHLRRAGTPAGRALREGGSILVGVIDLDGFKSINDVHGHQNGDIFLQEMGRRLAASLRASDMLGRLGGDEFVLIGPGPALARGDAGPIGHEVLRGEAEEAARALEDRTAAATLGNFQLGEITLPTTAPASAWWRWIRAA